MAERDLPQETSQTRALHFSKGCYLGQEIVERIRSRGNVHRHLRQLELDGPTGDSRGGTVPGGRAGRGDYERRGAALGGSIRRLALAMVRSEAEVKNQPLTYMAGATAGTARILDKPPAL